jgi:predicted deacylase
VNQITSSSAINPLMVTGPLALDALAPGSRAYFRYRFADAPDGTPLSFPMCVIRGSQPGPRLTITAGVHGDEYEGPRGLSSFLRTLDPDQLRGTVVGVPICNPTAFVSGTRFTPSDGLNLNRSFPGDVNGPPTMRLAWHLFNHVVVGSDLVADLHSGGTRYIHLPLAAFYSLPGEVGTRSLAAARSLNLPVLWAAPLRPGVLSYEAVMAGIPAIGTEVGGMGTCKEEDVHLYQSSLRGLLTHLNILDVPLPPPATGDIHAGDWIGTQVGGLFRALVKLGDEVRPNQAVAEVLDEWGDVRQQILSPVGGRVLGLRTFISIQAGDMAAIVLSPTPEAELGHRSLADQRGAAVP